MLLAFDTATPTVTVALHDDTDVVAELASEETMRHGEQLAPLIDRALSGAGLVRQDLTAIAVGVGPGPFTGLRPDGDVDGLTWWDPSEDQAGLSAIDAHLVRVLRGT